MKTNKFRFLSVLLVFVLLLSSVTLGPVSAADAETVFGIADAQAFIGEKFYTDLYVDNVDSLQSGMLVFSYDESALTFERELSYVTSARSAGLSVNGAAVSEQLDFASRFSPAVAGRKYVSYIFAANDAPVTAAAIAKNGSARLVLASLCFTVNPEAAAGEYAIRFERSDIESGDKIGPVATANAKITVSAKQTVGSGVSAVSYDPAGAAVSADAFSGGSNLETVLFTSPAADYPYAAFNGLRKLKKIAINLTAEEQANSRFFTDDGILFIRDTDSDGKLLDTCKIYLIPAAHAAEIYLSDKVTGFYSPDALQGKPAAAYDLKHPAHIPGDSAITTAPLCEADGVRTYYCTICGAVAKTETVAPLGHDWGDWRVTTAPLCEAKGVETRVCRHDASHTETRDVTATGHDWGDWQTVTAPDCTNPGSETRVCRNDATHTETREIAALGHNWGVWTTVVAPTCTEKGSETRVCLNDATHTETREIAAKGHTWTDEKVIRSATCVTPGLKSHVCSVCGQYAEFSYTDGNAHNWYKDGTEWKGLRRVTVWRCAFGCGSKEVQNDRPGSSYGGIVPTTPTTTTPTTTAPTTAAPTTAVPTTAAPTTAASTTTAAPTTTEAPTTTDPFTVPSQTAPAPKTTVPAPSAPSTEPTQPTVTYKLGDVNGDGRVNSVDARLVLRVAARLDTFNAIQQRVGDINKDGRVNSVDARRVLRAAARLEALPDELITA